MGKVGILRPLAGLVVACAALALAGVAGAAPGGTNPSDYRSCEAFLGSIGNAWRDHSLGVKLEKGDVEDFNGTFTSASPNNGETWSHGTNDVRAITITNARVTDGRARFDFTSSLPVDYVVVKAGSGANVYAYPQWLNDTDGPWSATGLESPKDSISHVLLCTFKKLRVEKTAAGLFTRTYAWSVDKLLTSPQSGTLQVPQGDEGEAGWQIAVTKTGQTDSNAKVVGSISVLNTASFSTNVQLDESLDTAVFGNGCSGTNVSDRFTLGKGAKKTCTYEAPVASTASGTNSVTAKSESGSSYMNSTASAGFSFGSPTTVVHGTVGWTDSNGRTKAGITGNDTTSYASRHVCDRDGKVTNVVTLKGDGGAVLDTDDATLQLDCVPKQALRVSKTVDESVRKRFPWTIGKTASPTTIGLYTDEEKTIDWTVTADRGAAILFDFQLSGKITVGNPNDWPVTAVVSDVVSTPAASIGGIVTCDGDATVVVPANGSVTCEYTVDLGDAPTTTTGTNRAYATVANDAAYSGSGTADFAFGEDDVIETLDASATVTDTLEAAGSPNGETVSGDQAWKYSTPATCQNGDDYRIDNTATLVPTDSGEARKATASASVAVECRVKLALTVTKTVSGSFTKRNRWDVEKTATPVSQTLTSPASGSIEWSVSLTRLAPDYVDFLLEGTITVGNPNDFAVSGVEVTDSMPGAVVTCPADEIPAGGTLTCSYTVDLGDALEASAGEGGVIGGENTATASTTTKGVSDGTDTVAWSLDLDEPTTELYANVVVQDSNGTSWTNGGNGFATSWEGAKTYHQAVTCVSRSYVNVVNAIALANEGPGVVVDTDSATASVKCVTPTPPTKPPVQHTEVDLSLTKVDRVDPITLGQDVTYDLVVTNNGPNTAFGVILEDALPAGVTFVSATPSTGTCSYAAGVVSCKLGNLLKGASAQVTIVGRPTATGRVTNVAITMSETTETKTANNRDDETTTIVAPVTPPTKPKPPVTKPGAAKPAPKPVAICVRLTILPRMLMAGADGRLTLVTTAGQKPKAGVRIRISGAGLSQLVRTGANGRVVVTVKPKRAGIVKLTLVGVKACNGQRIGVVGAFEPPVTG